MASRSNTGKSSNQHKKKNNSSVKKQQVKDNGAVQDEIILVITLVVSVLLFLSNISLCGKVGGYISSFIFGIIGLQAYLIPFLLFFGMAFHISNRGSKAAGRKILSTFVFIVALAGLIQLIISPDQDISKMVLWDFYQNAAKNHSGGGIVGGILVKLFNPSFGRIATYVILIAVMAISLIVITGKAIFTYVAKKSRSSIKEQIKLQRMKREEQEEFEDEINPGQYRRPPKTFILDADAVTKSNQATTGQEPVINSKERKMKKGQADKNSKAPVFDFERFFTKKDKKSEETNNKEDLITLANGTVPTYEDELRDKFGIADNSTGVKFIEHEDKFAETGVAQPEIHIVNSIYDNIDKTMDMEHPTQTAGDMEQTNAMPSDGSTKQQNAEALQTTGRPDEKQTEHEQKALQSLDIKAVSEEKEYIFPPLNLLVPPKAKAARGGNTEKALKETAMKLQSTLESFGVHVTITNVSCGPAVTRYELQPEQGVKVSSITRLSDDIKLNLAAADIRIEAPIPGKAAVGIEVPNKENSMVTLREMFDSTEFKERNSGISFAVGKDIGGQTIITDIAKMPHLLIAGATGSGKSVCINTLIMSILYKSNPSDVRLIMVDPKVVELSVYNGIPHLLIPVVTDPKKASAALNWAVIEMTERYKKFADVGVRDLKGYNEKIKEVEHLHDENYQRMPQIVIIIDELADLMMVAQGEVEDAICRLAQLARAAGIHLIIATQRPSVNVITGLIKANIPSRIAFAVSSSIDSRTIIDGSGAEKLLGRGDMLFFPSGYPKPVRIQGAFISDKEVSAVVDFLLKHNNEAKYSDEIKEKITNAKPADDKMSGSNSDDRDDYFAEAGKFIIEKDKASIGMLQRVYKIGFNRAARIMDQLAEAGVVGPEEGTKPRKILMSEEQFQQYIDEN